MLQILVNYKGLQVYEAIFTDIYNFDKKNFERHGSEKVHCPGSMEAKLSCGPLSR